MLCFGGEKEAVLIGTPRYVLIKLRWLLYSLLIIWQWSWFVCNVMMSRRVENEQCRYVPGTTLAWNKAWQKLTGHRHLRMRLRMSTHNHTGSLSVTRLTDVWAVTHYFIGVIVSVKFLFWNHFLCVHQLQNVCLCLTGLHALHICLANVLLVLLKAWYYCAYDGFHQFAVVMETVFIALYLLPHVV